MLILDLRMGPGIAVSVSTMGVVEAGNLRFGTMAYYQNRLYVNFNSPEATMLVVSRSK